MKKLLISILVALALFSTISCSAASNNTSPTILASATVSKASSLKSNGYITKAQFSKVNNGMSYEQVKKIVGSSGKVLSKYDSRTQHMIVYKWVGKSSMSYAVFQFLNNKLIVKSQAYLS